MAQCGSGTDLIPAALVVPILNEAPTLPRLLAGIEQQTKRPRELVFVDGGSHDGGPLLIAEWWRRCGWPGGSCNVIANAGGLPGGNRNAGIRHANQPWIAFLDGGIEPAADWLEQLYRHAEKTSSRAVSGVCRFDGDGTVELAVCALSSGVGIAVPVLPASLFQHDVFTEAGFFREDLRAAEDLEWLRRLTRANIKRQICTGACVSYRHFPHSATSAVCKWFVYEINTARAGVRRLQQIGYVAAFATLLLIAFFSMQIALIAVAAYWFTRGIADPIRRSGKLCWWRRQPRAFVCAAMLGPCLDLAKLAGILASLPQHRQSAF